MTAADDLTDALDRLAEEFVERARAGEAPSIEEYVTAHPELAEDIREVFPVLAVVEGLKVLKSGAGAAARPTTADGSGDAPAATGLPSRIGRYEILREIGRGGMGSVHEGRPAAPADGESPDRVAIKVIHAHLLERTEYIARFLREAEAGRRVRHPNVVRTLATGLLDRNGDEVPYLVLEYVEGQNLRALLTEVDVVPERLCRHVGVCLADALAAIHAVGLVHRDVKPENIVITADETVKLTDLGIAVLQDRQAKISQTGDFVGSLLYAAPEQLLGAEPDPRWDLYGLGVVLYELATGQHPAREQAARWLQREDTPRARRAPSTLEPRVSPFFDAVVETLLAPRVEDRFASADEVREVLEAGERSAWWRARPGRAVPALRDHPTGFHGRREEWQTLEDLLAEVREGSGRALLLLGDAGMGKTRLVGEWIAARRQADGAPRVIEVQHGPSVVGGDEGDLPGALLEVLGGPDVEVRVRRLLGTQAPLAETLTRRLRGESVVGVDRTALDAALVRLLRGLAEEHPLVLVLEDLHFASPEARQRFVLFARALRADPILLIGTARPLPAPTWAADLRELGHVSRLHLSGLDAAACRDLVLDAARGRTDLGESVTSLAERSDRNPFFLLELVRERVRRPRRADASLATDTTIPESIRGMIEARLAQLEPGDRELLAAAACCGHEFDPIVVAEAAGQGRIAALKRFGHLERAHGLLGAARRNYTFRHHLVQEVLYAEMHPALKETYHAALGSALEAETAARGGADAELAGPRAVGLCSHFLEGRQPARARPYLRRALQHLRETQMAYTRAAALAERALDLDDALRGQVRSLALYLHGRALTSTGRTDEAMAALSEALPLAREAEATALEIDILGTLGWLHRRLGQNHRMQEAYTEAADRARAAGDRGREATILAGLGFELVSRGRIDEAETILRRGFEALEAAPGAGRESRLLTSLAEIEVERGHLAKAEELLERAQRLAHGVADYETEMGNLSGLGQLALLNGRFAAALDYATRSLDVGRQLGMTHWDVDMLVNIAYCLLELSRLDEALDRAQEAFEIAERTGDQRNLAQTRIRRGVIRTALGDLTAALEDLETGRALAEDLGLPHVTLQVTVARGELLGLLGRHDEASAMVTEARGVLGAEWPVLMRARLHALEGRLHEMRGCYDDVRASLETARELTPPGEVMREGLTLPLGRSWIRSGEPEKACEPLREALAWGRRSGAVRLAVLAEAYLAMLPDGDLLAARVALERNEARLAAVDRIEAHFALWEASDDVEHLSAAWRAVRSLQKRAPSEDRALMVENVDLFRRVQEAFNAAALTDG